MTKTKETMMTRTKVDPTSFSTRDVPWAKIGTVIEKPLPVAQALKKAGLDWNVELQPVKFTHGGKSQTFTGRSVIVRSDTGQPFGVASDGYSVIQNTEAFEFIDAISPEIVAAGSLKGGRQAFIVCKAPDRGEMDLLDGDMHDLYVVLRTSHDLSKAVEVFLMPLRGMCMNQLPLKTLGRHAKQSWSVRHVPTAKARLAEAQGVIAGLDNYRADFEDTAKRLAAIDLEIAETEELLRMVLPDRPKRQEQVDTIIGLFDHGERVGERFHHTGWGLVNAVGEYFEHARPSRSDSVESRFTNGLNGSINKYVNRAAQLLVRR